MSRRLVPMPKRNAIIAERHYASPAAPRLHALQPFGWPPKNYDVMALVGTVCLMGVLWPYRYAVLFAGAVYFLGRGWFWIGRNYPMVMWFIYGMVRGLFR